MKCPKCGKEMINNKCECGYIAFTGFGETIDTNPKVEEKKDIQPVMEDIKIPQAPKKKITAEEMLKKTDPTFVENKNPFA